MPPVRRFRRAAVLGFHRARGVLATSVAPRRRCAKPCSNPKDGASLPREAETVVGELNRPQTLTEALVGASAIHLLAGYEGLSALLADARAAGVQCVVLQSSSAAPTGDLRNAVAAYHIRSEQVIRESGLPWTFLQPNTFMTNTLDWAAQLAAGDEVRAAFPEVAVATIDPADVAAVSAAALTDHESHDGASYQLSGPEALKPADRARILGQVLGRDVHQPTVQRLLDRPPRSSAQWAETHAHVFR